MKKVVDHAIPLLTKPSKKPKDKVSAASTHIAALKESPHWDTAAEVQKAAAAWTAENDGLDEDNQRIAEIENELAMARARRLARVRRWNVRKRLLLNAVNIVCDGSKDKVQSFGLAVATRKPRPPAVVPEGLRGKRSKTAGMATVVWTTARHNRGFLLQYTTDPKDPATFVGPIMTRKGKFELAGQTPGATIYFRVLALDPVLPNGQTEYSPWVAAMVSC